MKQVKMSSDFTYPINASTDRTLLPGHTFTVSDEVAQQIIDQDRGEVVASDDDDDFDEETSAPVTEAKRGRRKAVATEDAPSSDGEPTGEEAPAA
jgi:hypothetical protein